MSKTGYYFEDMIALRPQDVLHFVLEGRLSGKQFAVNMCVDYNSGPGGFGLVE